MYILIKLSPYQHLLLYCVCDRFVLLHKIPNICRFYPYFSMFISVFDLSVICTSIGKTDEAEYCRRVAKF